MGIDTTIIDRRVRNAMKHLGSEVTFGGEDYPCYPTAMRDNALRNRGPTFRETYDTSVGVIAADVTIAKRDVVTFNGTVRRVLDTSDTPDGLQTILHLGKQFGGDVSG